MRTCTRCGEVKNLENDYYNDKNGHSGKAGICKNCNRIRLKERRHSHNGITGRIENATKRWSKARKRVHRFSYEQWASHMERKRNASVNHCYYCATELQSTDKKAENFFNLEHIKGITVPRATHSVGNVVPSCRKCNSGKSSKPVTDFLVSEDRPDPELCYVGLADNFIGVDNNGNPLTPIHTEWEENTSTATEAPQIGFCQYLKTFHRNDDTPARRGGAVDGDAA